MLEYINSKTYAQILHSKRRGGVDIHKHYGQCMHTLISRWAARLSSHQLAILMLVFDRTFYHNKLSETVVFDQFLHGMQRSDRDEMVFCGLNISLPTLLKQLKELADEDFLHVRACVDEGKRGETKARLYAINCKKLFNLDIADEENPMILREPKQKKSTAEAENEIDFNQEVDRKVLKTPRKVGQTPSKIPPKKVEGIYIHNTGTKVPIVGGASHAETSSAESILERVEQQRQQRLATSAARRSSRPTRTSKAGTLNRADVQRMIDDAMSQYHPTLPRVSVNDKALGVLRKRVAEAKIDFPAFLDWAIQAWRTTASSHARAAVRRVGEETKHAYTPMPDAPDFNTLSYRFPYFAACYRSHVQAAAAGVATNREQVLEQKVERLTRQVQSVKESAHSAITRERNMRRKAAAEREQAAPPANIRRTRPAARAAVLEDDIPAWDDFPAEQQRRSK